MRYLFFSSLIFLSSCITYNQYTQNAYTSRSNDQPNRLTEIPLSSHNNEIEVFFGDEKPKEEYVKALLLEEISYGEVSYGTLVNKMKRQAQEEGVDALIILSRDRNIAETEFSFTVTNTLSALGIKYTKNLLFKEGIPKQAILSIYDEEKAFYKPTEQFLLNEKGKVKFFNQSNIYLNNFHRHSLDYMLYEADENWWVYFNESSSVIDKRQHRTFGKTTTFTFIYDTNRKVRRVLRSHFLQEKLIELDIEFEYKNGRISKSKIYQKTGHRENIKDENGQQLTRIHKRTEVYEYHADGRPLRRTIFQIRNNEPKPFMKLSYDYYTEEDYNQLIRNKGKATL